MVNYNHHAQKCSKYLTCNSTFYFETALAINVKQGAMLSSTNVKGKELQL